MSRILSSLILTLVVVGLLAGCPAPESEDGAIVEDAAAVEIQLPEQVRKAVEIAKAMETDPDRVEDILGEAVMTADEYEALLYDIAADPELSRLYKEAMAD